jgi:hypothetical protein
VLRVSLALLVASLLECDALAENPGLNPSTEPTPQSARWGSFSPDGTMITALREPGEATQDDIYVIQRGRHRDRARDRIPA